MLAALTSSDLDTDGLTLGAECSLSAMVIHSRVCTCDWYETCGPSHLPPLLSVPPFLSRLFLRPNTGTPVKLWGAPFATGAVDPRGARESSADRLTFCLCVLCLVLFPVTKMPGGGANDEICVLGLCVGSRKCGTPWYYYAGVGLLVVGGIWWGLQQSKARTAPQ